MTDEIAHKMHTKNPPKMGSGGLFGFCIFYSQERRYKKNCDHYVLYHRKINLPRHCGVFRYRLAPASLPDGCISGAWFGSRSSRPTSCKRGRQRQKHSRWMRRSDGAYGNRSQATQNGAESFAGGFPYPLPSRGIKTRLGLF